MDKCSSPAAMEEVVHWASRSRLAAAMEGVVDHWTGRRSCPDEMDEVDKLQWKK